MMRVVRAVTDLILPMAVIAYLFVGEVRAQEMLPKAPPVPEDNPTTPEKVLLGKTLFFDPRLSFDGTVSCNSCHNVMGSGDDGRAASVGIRGQVGSRGAPTVWNAAFLTVQFWDGRAKTLEEQAKGPLVNPIEMGMPDHQSVINRLKKISGYRELFEKAFGKKDPITIDNVAKAIAAYERTLIVPSRFDRWMAGEKNILSKKEQEGFEVMKTVGCFSCHMGPNFAGPQLPLGTGFFQKFPVYPSDYDKKYDLLSDLGRYEVTKDPNDKNRWRVPTLRNVALTAPYFHNGKVKTLDEAVRVMGKSQLNVDLTKDQVEKIVAFLKTLNGEFPKQEMPRLPVGDGGSSVVE
ncbi:MAG: cytochrome-c peroxidase [Bdellovibrionaceae bacterium]|nr:cytochrome-c peroxidase [Pseudobdellovibrionaceae bacterium]MDW8190666.1 cytochrome-c peroxidase [Pseudobdellovibrionaceae bacterium]